MNLLTLSSMTSTCCCPDFVRCNVASSPSISSIANPFYGRPHLGTMSMRTSSSNKNKLLKSLVSASTTLSFSPFLGGQSSLHLAPRHRNEALVKLTPASRIVAQASGRGAAGANPPENTPNLKVDEEKAAKQNAADASKLNIGMKFAVWWSLNVVFNIYNKKVLNVYPFPWLTSTLSLAAGSGIMLISWALKILKAPEVDFEFWRSLAPQISLLEWQNPITTGLVCVMQVALAHTIGHVAATISMSKVAVSFTHIIKSSEPAFSVIIQRIVFGDKFPYQVYLSLLPIIGGCALAAATELNFNMTGFPSAKTLYCFRAFMRSWCCSLRIISLACKFLKYLPGMNNVCSCWWTGFTGAMISNIFFVFRNIFSKKGMSKSKKMGGMNYYACLSMMSLVFLTPFAIAVEGPRAWTAGWQAATLAHGDQVFWWVVAQSVFYHLYNQVSYMSLDKISPLTFSVGNTMKRVTVIVSSIIMFNTKVSPINAVGAAIAVFGTFLYSQVDLRDPKSGQNAWNYFYKIHQISTLEMYPAAIMILKPKSPSFIHIVLVNAL
uniref:Sugar phosphate transporter domain-containing protein n=1 Tax=Physcomitrium patens TaxID=3218 RepID=A0A7I4CJR5_PHYPA